MRCILSWLFLYVSPSVVSIYASYPAVNYFCQIAYASIVDKYYAFKMRALNGQCGFEIKIMVKRVVIEIFFKSWGSSMSFYPDFILILSCFYLDFILILSRFYPDFLKTHLIQILSWFYPNFENIWIKSG